MIPVYIGQIAYDIHPLLLAYYIKYRNFNHDLDHEYNIQDIINNEST